MAYEYHRIRLEHNERILLLRKLSAAIDKISDDWRSDEFRKLYPLFEKLRNASEERPYVDAHRVRYSVNFSPSEHEYLLALLRRILTPMRLESKATEKLLELYTKFTKSQKYTI